jgi:pyruvate dehydrogenase E1 component alpha subunit
VYAVVSAAVAAASRGEGPTLIEAITYRIEAHTNADDATRYRDRDEVEEWLAKDPIDRLRTYLTERGLLDETADAQLAATAEAEAEQLRGRMNVDTEHDPRALFRNVYATQTPALRRQEQELLDEIAADAEQEA